MTHAELRSVLESSNCKVAAWQDIRETGHRLTLARFAEAFSQSETHLLSEPSLARSSRHPPDIVLVDPEIGVHVIEVKGVTLEQIKSIDGGGLLRIQYNNGVRPANVITQVRQAMFDIKDATSRAWGGNLNVRFEYWVVFPRIRRSAWQRRFGEHGFCPDQFLFEDDLQSRSLALRLGAIDRNQTASVALQPIDQLQCVWKAFGDNSVLYFGPDERKPRTAKQGTLGELFDTRAEEYKTLSDGQERLSRMNWDEGPRLVRGVAGSGKTIVLANNLSRRLVKSMSDTGDLFAAQKQLPRVLAVCFNRTLAPYLRKKIEAAFAQRCGRALSRNDVQVLSFNGLMFELGRSGLWTYEKITDPNPVLRAQRYLAQLENTRRQKPQLLESLAYDAVYVDEGQDFVEDEFKLLKALCRLNADGEPNLFIFYDDAQNLYGRPRPNWQSLGLSLMGRRVSVMTECFRNTQQIVEASFNVLYGSCAPKGATIPPREYGDLGRFEQNGLVRRDAGLYRVHFAKRTGGFPIVTMAPSKRLEDDMLVARLHALIHDEDIRPEDILVLAPTVTRAEQLAAAIDNPKLRIEGVHLATIEKDSVLCPQKKITVSTVHSAKGYDAYVVLIASANEFASDLTGRASFYVGCTRAIEYLEVFGYQTTGLLAEMDSVVSQLKT